MARLVLLRHGESTWNREQRFTGWADVDLTPQGIEQTRLAGRALKRFLPFDVAFCSALRRCTHSLTILLQELNCPHMQQHIDWRLNERHYGALTGKSKREAAMEFGEDIVTKWRRSYDEPPPPSPVSDFLYMTSAVTPGNSSTHALPRSESLHQTAQRVSKAWEDSIRPVLQQGKSALVLAHGNSLRALRMRIERLSPNEVSSLEIGNAEPCVYDLDDGLHPRSMCLLNHAMSSPSEIL